jgi:hypothetical protein
MTTITTFAMFMQAHYHALAMFTSRCHCALVQVGRRLCQRCRTCFSDGQLVPWRGAQRVKATDRVHREALNGSSQIRPAVLQHHLAMCGAPVRRNMLHLLRCTGRRGRRTRRLCCGVRQLLIRSSGVSGPLLRCGAVRVTQLVLRCRATRETHCVPCSRCPSSCSIK